MRTGSVHCERWGNSTGGVHHVHRGRSGTASVQCGLYTEWCTQGAQCTGGVHRVHCTEEQCTGGGESGHWPAAAAAAPPCSYSYNPTLLFIASTAAFYVPLLLPAGATCIGCKVKCFKVSEAKKYYLACT